MKRTGLLNEPSPDCAAAGALIDRSTGTTPTAKYLILVTIWWLPWLTGNDALVQPGDRVERREDRALLPGRNIRGMLAGERDAAVDGTQVAIVLLAHVVIPLAEAAEHPGHAMPADRNAVLVF